MPAVPIAGAARYTNSSCFSSGGFSMRRSRVFTWPILSLVALGPTLLLAVAAADPPGQRREEEEDPKKPPKRGEEEEGMPKKVIRVEETDPGPGKKPGGGGPLDIDLATEPARPSS